MEIYIHKVREGSEDGFGRSFGHTVRILGHYLTHELAKKAKEDRDNCLDNRYLDIGESWIEKSTVYEE